MASVSLSLSSKINKENGKSEVLLRYRNTREVALRAKTHVFILPKYFKDGEIVIKARVLNNEVRDANLAKTEVERIVRHLIDKGNATPIESFYREWAQEQIDRLLYPELYETKPKEAPGFFDLFESFLQLHKMSNNRRRTYRVFFRVFMRFELYNKETLNLDTATPETIARLEDFLRNEYKLFEEAVVNGRKTMVPIESYKNIYESIEHGKYPKQRGENTIISALKELRAFWHWCNDMGYTNNDPFKKYNIKEQIYGTPIYLTIAERDRLYAADIPEEHDLRTLRDIFILQCNIGCRIGDLYSFTTDNLIKSDKGTAIQYIPGKTKDEKPRVVKVYLTKTALEILERNKGRRLNYLMPYYDKNKLNRGIRKVLELAGIDRTVTVINPSTGKSEQHPIYEVASSHMARRTFVGNLYKKVKDPCLVGKLSGHSEHSRAFTRYRDIDDDMVREMTDLLE